MATGINITATNTFPKGVLSPKRVRAYILNAGLKSGDHMESMLKEVTKHWRHHVGRTKPKIRYARGDALVSITIYDDVFWYLNDGTTERWAVMAGASHPEGKFVRKTAPGRFSSGSGGGRTDPVLRGKRHMKMAKKGIDARNWVPQIEGRSEIELKRRIDMAIQQSFKLGP